MTITLKPIHVVLVAFVLGLLVAGGGLLAFSADGDGEQGQALIVVTATVDPRGLSTSDAPPTPTAVPPTAVPEPPAPPPQPVRSCAEIRAAGTYLNDVERDFFLGSCQTPASGGAASPPVQAAAPSAPVPAPAPPAPPIVNDPAAAEAERAYRVRAEATTYDYLARARVWEGSPTTGQVALLEYAGIAGGWANQMSGFAPVPIRFQRAHDQLQSALRALEAHALLFVGKPYQITEAYFRQLVEHTRLVNVAFADYVLVVGLTPR